MKFVVIGADAAGMSAASRAKRKRPELEVIVLEQSQDVSYSACSMPYNIADPDRDIDDLVVRKAQVFRDRQGIDLRTGHKVTSIDPTSKQVSGVADGQAFQESYDHLLIATGASSICPPLPGFDLPGVVSLKTLEDGRKIKDYLQRHNVNKVVIIGMGYIALEMCESLRTRGIEIDMVKKRSKFMPWMDETLSAEIKKELEKHGAKIYPGHEVQKIEKTEEGLRVVCSDLELSGQMVLVAIGVKPNSQLAAKAGIRLDTSGAIEVDQHCLSSVQDIYAAGDCATAYHMVTGKKSWIPLALIANRGGWVVADNVTGTATTVQGIVGTATFKVFSLQVARTGLSHIEAEEYGFEPVSVTIQGRTRAHNYIGSSPIWAHMVGDRKSGRLLGVQLVGNEGPAHRINAPAVALQTKMSVKDFCQCDLAYAPPFGPVWSPTLTAANKKIKKM